MFFEPIFRPRGGIALEAYGNFEDTKEFVKTNLLELGLRDLYCLEAALFAHPGRI